MSTSKPRLILLAGPNGAGISFITETVFSDPVGEKVSVLQEAVSKGFRVDLIFIGHQIEDRQECLSYAEETKNYPSISDAGVLEFRL